jgi:Xaa-Pro dipeptidase
MKEKITAIQVRLEEEGLDGWLLYDFRGLNPVAQPYSPFKGMLTRRWFLLIPRKGRPIVLAHRIEECSFAADWAELRLYSGWRELEAELKHLLKGCKAVAMEYSAGNAIPYVAFVDAGTLEMIRATGVEVRSSANMIQHFSARWTAEGLASHRQAAAVLLKVQRDMFEYAAGELSAGRDLSDYQLQQRIHGCFSAAGMESEHPSIVGSGPRSAMPHYEPSVEVHYPIRRGELLLLDIFCRKIGGDSITADITWTAYMGKPPVPKEMLELFKIVTAARDRGVEVIQENLAAGRPVSGAMVDDAVRGVIEKAGFGKYFTHRTGHSLGHQVHGNGVNLDNLETRDERLLEPGLGFTIEPGIYLPDRFGVRSEINCYVSEGGLEVTTLPLQTELPAML